MDCATICANFSQTPLSPEGENFRLLLFSYIEQIFDHYRNSTFLVAISTVQGTYVLNFTKQGLGCVHFGATFYKLIWSPCTQFYKAM
jgi:hypothetical protein